ncbi:hypothetical protein COB11_03825 [Candidatus Aerophobetes bacterium]|uniref:Uncharacterized protein n=1 Tax=Aerophobetes bacterium TaxID=2030807 RepID=A0A2A4YJI5_UNCAE|nr:MAG: hypothetical protein COB11_03825 [Candidatus Aerophobetes bacterium]
MSLSTVYRDASLCGHALTTLPHKIWDFSKSELSLIDRPVPGTYVVDHDVFIGQLFIGQRVHYNIGPTTVIYRTVFFTEELLLQPLVNTIEFIGRRILGSCATAISFLVLTPVGFTTKLLHLGARQVSTYVTSSSLGVKIKQVWQNANLFGHLLTSAPSKCYQFATAPLNWHLRPDGTDRRFYIYAYESNNGESEQQVSSNRPLSLSGTTLLHDREYSYSFEVELICRRIFGGLLTVTAAVVSPIGLASKSIHLIGRSVLS